MKKLLLSLLFAAMSSAALAAEPLTEQQMDTVTAGQPGLGGSAFLGAFSFEIPGLTLESDFAAVIVTQNP
jgi:hypothetical protein